VEDSVETPRVEAVTHRKDVSVVIVEGNAGAKGEARGILETIAEAYPGMELIAHEQMSDTHSALVWLGSREDADELQVRFRELRGPGGEWAITVQRDAAFVSLVGFGLGATQAARAEGVLEKAGVRVHALRAAPSALVFRVDVMSLEAAVKALHAAFLE
jgi:aspartokinase